MAQLRQLGETEGFPLHVQGLPAAFHASFGSELPIHDYQTLRLADDELYRLFVAALTVAGIWVASRGIWYLSAAHSEDEIDVTIERASKAFRALRS
jgi:glutamate-1-semialdehyde 2,1-aminomutase